MLPTTHEGNASHEEPKKDQGLLSLWNKWGEQDVVAQYDANPELRKEITESIQNQIDKDIIKKMSVYLGTTYPKSTYLYADPSTAEYQGRLNKAH